MRRLNRFVIEVRPDREGENLEEALPIKLHLPNSGRMQELLTPDAPGLAVLDGGGERKTAGTLLLVRYSGRWVGVDARLPNRLLESMLTVHTNPLFKRYDTWRSEAPWGKGRIDFLLSSPHEPDFLVETKSCNLVEGGLALFPDAPTQRGTRHLMELTEAVHRGMRAAVIWFVQRDDAEKLAPNRHADPDFAAAMDAALAAGVQMQAFRCLVESTGVTVLDRIPIRSE